MKIKITILILTIICLMPLLSAEGMEPFKIGLAGNFSAGSDSTNNQWHKFIYPAAKLALDDFLNKNPRYKDKVQLIKLDHKAEKEQVLETVKSAKNHGVVAVVGYSQSEYAEIAAKLFEELRIPMITHTATADKITKNRMFIHRVCFTNSEAANHFAIFSIKRLKISSVISLPVSSCLYCTDLSQHFLRAIKSNGATATLFESDFRGHFNWKEVFNEYSSKKMMGSNAAFFVPNHEDASARMVATIIKNIENPIILGGDGWGDKGELFFKIIGNHSINAYKFAHWTSDFSDYRSKQFVRNFVDKKGYMPVESSALMYDAITILLKAIKESPHKNSLSINKTLLKTINFEGVTGLISLDSSLRHNKKPVIQKVQSGKFRIVK